jgi:uncharacterized protein YtpQ (UPF0354 family)
VSRPFVTEEEFGRMVVARARRERPEIRVKAMGRLLLLVEGQQGQRIVSLSGLYQCYCADPEAGDEQLESFLRSLSDEDPSAVQGSFLDNKEKVLPQVVPPSLLDYCRRDGRELASIGYVAGLSVAFVVDEPERYTYIHKRVMRRWGVGEADLLSVALRNLEALSSEEDGVHRLGQGERLALVWESYDGYDASRILLGRELVTAAAQVAGNPIIAIPHRDYMVMFGDADPDFVCEMAERLRKEFEANAYPITSRFFTLVGGRVAVYEGYDRHRRVVN